MIAAPGQPCPLRSDFTRDADVPMNGTFPYYSDGVAGEKYTNGNFKATNGRLYKVSTSGEGTPLAWYPAPGFRDCGYYGRGGQPDNVGYGGFSWSPAVGGTNRIYGTFLSFYTQRLNPNSSGYRAHGVQLRCLAE